MLLSTVDRGSWEPLVQCLLHYELISKPTRTPKIGTYKFIQSHEATMSRMKLVFLCGLFTIILCQPASASLEFDVVSEDIRADLDVKLSFDRRVDPVRSVVRIYDFDGREVPTTSIVRTNNTQTALFVAVNPLLPPGAYVIKWKVYFIGVGTRSGTSELQIGKPTKNASLD